jgi:predicted transcriptional regulator
VRARCSTPRRFGTRWATGGEVREAGWTFAGGRCTPLSSGYTRGMKTAISIPDDVFADAEQLARELKKSRSRLYGDAVREYIARHSAESITEALDRVCDGVSPGDEFARTAARRTLERSDW